MSEQQLPDFAGLLRALVDAGVEFIVVGGVAGVAHGAARVTLDLDVLYRRSAANLDRLVPAIAALRPYPRGAPPNLPFVWDRRTVDFGLNFTLRTTFGSIDLLGEIAGGTYDELLPHSERMEVLGVTCTCLTLAALIRTKRAAGRPKDYEAIAELEILLSGRATPDDGSGPSSR